MTINPQALQQDIPNAGNSSVNSINDAALADGQSNNLEQQRLDLERKKEEQNLAHKKEEFTPTLANKKADFTLTYWLKIGAAFFSLIYLCFTSFLILKIVYCYADSPNWHLPLAIVVGSFTSNFAIIALLLKGIFSQDNASANASIPISLGEMVKTIASAWRSSSAK